MEPPTNVSGCSLGRFAHRRVDLASMEPPTNVSGCTDCQDRRRAQLASMEPPTNVSGYSWSRRPRCPSPNGGFNEAAHERERMPRQLGIELADGRIASMEPAPERERMRDEETGSALSIRCFDGAAHERERMPAARGASEVPLYASMEPPTNVSGCSACLVLIGSAGIGFNRAPHERERMHRRNAAQPLRPGPASMEPPTNVSGCRAKRGPWRALPP